jgi:hypothetical protein
MRLLIPFLLLLFSFNSKAQPKAALTAGSESLITSDTKSASITEPKTDQIHYSSPAKEAVIKQGSASDFPEKKSTISKDIIVLLAGLIIAISIYFVFKKNSSKQLPETSTVFIEEEKETQ